MTSTFTTEFHHEFEAERARWLRRRFLWYSGVVIAFGLMGVIGSVVSVALGKPMTRVGGQQTTITTTTTETAPAETAPRAADQPSGSEASPAPPATPSAADEAEPEAERSGAPQPAPPKTTTATTSISPTSTAVAYSIGPALIAIALYIWAFFFVRNRLLGREPILRIVYWLIVITGALQLLAGVIQFESMRSLIEGARSAGKDIPATSGLVSGSALLSIFGKHFFACLFLPWTPRESFRPLIPLLILNAVIILIYMGSHWLLGPLLIVGSPLVGAPGGLICWWRHGRFKDRFQTTMLRGRYTQMRQELTDARRIHEALFPTAIDEGPVRFDFRYQPMRQIGGDFLYVHRFPGVPGKDAGGPGAAIADAEPLSIVIIDVTGHGIPAALTVNRLHGELERLYGENPDIAPGDVLTALNRYVHLTLATHSVYATAVCLRIEPTADRLEWASGGHPPAFLRTVDGRIDRLDSTAFVLGACHGADFKSNQQSTRFGPGDTLVLYTDGATEARDARGQMLRVEGLQRIVAGLSPREVAAGGWASAVLDNVDRHRFGPPADDTLVVEVWRPLGRSVEGTPARAATVGAT